MQIRQYSSKPIQKKPLYQENRLTVDLVVPPRTGAGNPDSFGGNISWFRWYTLPKILILYQENMSLEKVARQIPPSVGSPDTEVSVKYLGGNVS